MLSIPRRGAVSEGQWEDAQHPCSHRNIPILLVPWEWCCLCGFSCGSPAWLTAGVNFVLVVEGDARKSLKEPSVP